MESVPITFNVVSSNPAHGEVYLIQYYMIKFVRDLWQICVFVPGTLCVFVPGTLVSSTNKTYLYDITKILLKVALNTMTHPPCKRHGRTDIYTTINFAII